MDQSKSPRLTASGAASTLGRECAPGVLSPFLLTCVDVTLTNIKCMLLHSACVCFIYIYACWFDTFCFTWPTGPTDPAGRCSASGVKPSALDLEACRRRHTCERHLPEDRRRTSVSQTTQATSTSLFPFQHPVDPQISLELSLPPTEAQDSVLIRQALTGLLLCARHRSRRWDTSLLPRPLHSNGGDSNITYKKLVKNMYARR